MRTNLDTDPAVVRIATGQKMDRFSVVGRLHKIWAWANEHLADGQDVPIDSEFLDALVECQGFSDSLRSVGWLSGRDGSLCFPSFERHNGASAKARALDASRKKQTRETSEKCPDSNRTKLGPDKNRIDKKSNTKNTKKKNETPHGFETWWGLYPKKVAKGHAEAAYKNAISEIQGSQSLSAEDAQAKLVELTSQRIPTGDVQYMPHPATWLNAKRYLDEVESGVRCKPIDFNDPNWRDRRPA